MKAILSSPRRWRRRTRSTSWRRTVAGLSVSALTKARVDQLGLDLMSRANGTANETAFTVSIEAA